MKIAFKVSLIAILMALLFTACQKEDYDLIIPENPDYQTDTVAVNPLILEMKVLTSDYIYISCVKIAFPIVFLQASGNTITINSEAELESASMLSDSIVDFVYPVEAEDDNGPILIMDIEDLVIAIQSCEPTVTDCAGADPHVLLFFNGLNILTLNRYVYTINYPVSLIVDGNPVVINNNAEYLPAVGGSPFDLLPTELVYPITVTQFGQEIVLNNDNDVCQFYGTLDEPCENKPAHIQFFFNEGGGTPVSCTYFIDYPVDIFLNGSPAKVQSRDEYLEILISSPGAYDNIKLAFPLTVSKFVNGQQINFETEADICQYLNDCQ